MAEDPEGLEPRGGQKKPRFNEKTSGKRPPFQDFLTQFDLKKVNAEALADTDEGLTERYRRGILQR
jgi:hypothetical protein